MSLISEEDRRKAQAEQIIRAARDGGSVYIKNGKTTQTAQAGSIDFDLLRSSGALSTPIDQERSGIAAGKVRHQSGNAKRPWWQLWRFLLTTRSQL